MKIKQTARGFDRIDFKDRDGLECSLQKSSLATEDCIYLGCDFPDMNEFYPAPREQEEPFEPITMQTLEKLKHRHQNEIYVHSRMHLTREMVKELLPFLENFANRGELSE